MDGTPQDVNRSNSPRNKKKSARPSPEELAFSQGQGNQRSAWPSTTNQPSYGYGSALDSGSQATNSYPTSVSINNSFPRRSPLRPGESLPVAAQRVSEIIPTQSIDAFENDGREDDPSLYSTESYPEKGSPITTTTFSSKAHNVDIWKQDGSKENDSGGENRLDPNTSLSNLTSVKDRIKSLQIRTSSSQDQDENEDEDNDDIQNNAIHIKKRNSTGYGAISNGGNVNNFRNNSKSLISPQAAKKDKTPLTASFLVAINKYSPQPQQKQQEKQVQTKLTEPKEDKSQNFPFTPKQTSSAESQGSLGDGGLPTPGSSSTLIASWRQREASNVASSLSKNHSSSKKGPIVSIPNVTSIQSKVVEYDATSEGGSSQSSLTVPTLPKASKKILFNPSIGSSQDAQTELLSTLMNEMELKVEARLSQLEAQMAKEFKNKLIKMEERMSKKMDNMLNSLRTQR